MFENLRRYLGPKTRRKEGRGWKNWVAYVIFGAIILVFALFGLDNRQLGQSAGGVAAVVNHTTISLSEFRSRVENIEQNARMRFDQFPEAQRRAFSQELRKRALDELILGELVFQAANSRGVLAPDGEVRSYIRDIPVFQDQGRFLSDRYRNFLANTGQSAAEFERQVRKQLVTQRVQELFVGSATPSREELRRNRLLANQKVNVRFAELNEAALTKLITDADVQNFLISKKDEVEKYYNDNKVEFSSPEKIKARHILIRIDDKRPDADALKLASEIKSQATAQNFAQLAGKHSEDPGSKAKGGDLGEFERGRMVPAFEQAAFALKPGAISDPIKTDFGYHVVYLENKIEAQTAPLASVQNEIARKLLARSQAGEVKSNLKKLAEEGKKKEIEALIAKAGGKWQESGEFDLSSSNVPKLGEAPQLLGAVLKQGAKGGFVPEAITHRDGVVFAEILSWKQTPDKDPDVEGLERMVAFRKSADLLESWAKEVEAKASIERNPRLIQQ